MKMVNVKIFEWFNLKSKHFFFQPGHPGFVLRLLSVGRGSFVEGRSSPNLLPLMFFVKMFF